MVETRTGGARVTGAAKAMSNPVAAEARVFRSAAGSHLLIVDGSRVYDLPAAAASEIERDLAPGADGAVARALLGGLMDGSRPRYCHAAATAQSAITSGVSMRAVTSVRPVSATV